MAEAQTESKLEGSVVSYDPITARREQEVGRSKFRNYRALLDEDSIVPRSLDHYVSRADKEMQVAGLNINKVPEFLQPLYVKVMNLVKPAESRLEKSREELTHDYEAFKSLDTEVKNKLYGVGYTPTNVNYGKISGLIGKRMELEEKIGKYDEVRKFLDQEIATTYQRREKAKEQLEEKRKSRDAKAVWKLREDISAYDFDIKEYTKAKKVAETKIITNNNFISRYKDSISILNTLEDSIQENLISLGEDIECSKINHDEFKPIESIATLLPALEQKRKKHNEISQAFANKEDENYHRATTIAKQTLTTTERGTRSRMVQDQEKDAEAKNDERAQRCDQIVETLFNE